MSRSTHWRLLVFSGAVLLLLVVGGGFLGRRSASFSPRPDLPGRHGQVGAFALTNQFGKAFTRSNLTGQVWLADIIFTRCPGPCLKLSKLMAQLGERFSDAPNLRFLSLTADPEHDTAEVLAAYARRFQLPADRWTLLTGPKTNLYRLAVSDLRLSAVENSAGEAAPLEDRFIHSTQLVLIDSSGGVRGWFDGVEDNSAEVIADAVTAVLGEKGP